MREAKKILGLLKANYPQEIAIFESFSSVDRKRYAGYALRKKIGFLSPKDWIENRHSETMSFKQIALILQISPQEAVSIYEGAMNKLKKHLIQKGVKMSDTHIKRQLNYQDFIKSKAVGSIKVGFSPKSDWLNPYLFDYQREIVNRACEVGRYALFMDTGLGKSITQMNFAYCVYRHTNKPILMLAPLAVVYQMLKEADKFGFEISLVRNGEIKEGINIINYEQLDNLKGLEALGGVVLDESSILKSFTGATKRALLERFKHTPYKLACSATPSPNDYLELGNHSEFLGVMPSYEMIMRFFINDTMNAGGYRLKKHAISSFWEWVASWAECISSPANLGYDDSAFILPPLKEIIHKVDFDNTIYDNSSGSLFEIPSLNATTIASQKKQSLNVRLEKLKEILAKEDSTPHLVWVDTNLEADSVKKSLLDSGISCVEVRGSDSPEYKAKILNAFGNGEIPILITKASIAGLGLNFQNAHNMSFLGLNYSYESYYQAIRRMYRFGQKKEVIVNVILASSEIEILAVLEQKKKAHDEMKREMVRAVCKGKSSNSLKTTWNTNLNIPNFLKEAK